VWSIVTLSIASEADVVATRQRARRIAELLGFDQQDQTRIATAVSEIARNAFSYAGGGSSEFLLDAKSTPQAFAIRIADKGKGIADLECILEGRYRSTSGMGLGLVGARRLTDRFEITTAKGKGTQVLLTQHLPVRAPKITQSSLAEIARTLSRERSDDPLTALREQNRELIQNLDDLNRRQEEVQRLSKELGDTNLGVVALYAELDERANQLRTANEQKTRFLSNMSHEFRTPLNSVLALSRLLLDRVDGDLTAEQERQVSYILRSAEGLLELVNDLLDLAKVEAGKTDVKLGTFAIGDLFGALRGALKPLLTNPAVDLIFDPIHDVPEIFSDEAKVAQILRNLISNAIKFTQSGEVRVSAAYEPEPDSITFGVRDTGIGIAAESQSLIFEEFSQIDTKLHKKVRGTGLGLPLSRHLAQLLGGDITLESVVGQGSIFRLNIPARVQERPAKLDPVDTVGKRVLVIDDDETFQYVIRQIISGGGHYQVLEAIDGTQGLRRAREERPDMILLDLQMPHVDGFTVLNELRSDPGTDSIPVVISTSLTVDDDLRARLPTGMPIMSKATLSRETVYSLLAQAIRGPMR
jgi:signal transduction histidine kinase/CheY-like chemotaxis protein